jgi:hypothetical protein
MNIIKKFMGYIIYVLILGLFLYLIDFRWDFIDLNHFHAFNLIMSILFMLIGLWHLIKDEYFKKIKYIPRKILAQMLYLSIFLCCLSKIYFFIKGVVPLK